MDKNKIIAEWLGWCWPEWESMSDDGICIVCGEISESHRLDARDDAANFRYLTSFPLAEPNRKQWTAGMLERILGDNK